MEYNPNKKNVLKFNPETAPIILDMDETTKAVKKISDEIDSVMAEDGLVYDYYYHASSLIKEDDGKYYQEDTLRYVEPDFLRKEAECGYCLIPSVYEYAKIRYEV